MGGARPRQLQSRGGLRIKIRPRRACCRSCRRTQVLLPVSTLPRRGYTIEVIGAALVAKASGEGHRRIADRLGLPADTVRGWLRRFESLAETIRSLATVWAYRLSSRLARIEPQGSPFADAVGALGLALAAVVRRLGPARSPWHIASGLIDGALLAPPSRLSSVWTLRA